jgi:hypothetical protein
VLAPVGEVVGQQVRFSGKPVPWLEKDEHGQWRQARRN